MTRRRQFSERKLIKVYLDDTDYQRISESAKHAGTSISEWVRERCTGHDLRALKETAATLDAACESDYKVPKRAKDILAKAFPSNVCPHKKQRGELCYKCDPKFGLPSLT